MTDRAEPHLPTLEGTVWVLLARERADEWVAAAPHATALLDFGADGHLHGSTGCNRFSGRYTLDGDRLAIRLGPMTRAACVGETLAAQEQAVLAALTQVAYFVVIDGTLELTATNRSPLLRYVPSLADLEGTAWQATGVNNGRGGVESSALTPALTATFGPDGALSGSGGCNRFTATYRTSGPDGITISTPASTRRWCADEVMALEARYFEALERAATYRIAGERLELRDAGGALQVSFRLGDG